MRLTSLFLVCFLILSTTLHAEDASKKFVISKDEQAIIDLTNVERKKANLPALKANAQLFAAARLHSANMAKENAMEHELYGKHSSDRIAATGYKAMAGRENIAFNYPGPAQVVDGWMHSPEHKANILADDIGEIGVGIVNDSKGLPYYTQLFALNEANAVIVRFSIKNVSRKTMVIDLGGGEPSELKPNANSSFTLSAALQTPSITVECGDQKKSVKVKNGTKLTADMKNDALEVQGDVR
jgi:hypothetical protein